MTAAIGTAVHLTDDPVDTPGWHAARRARINGSEIAAVMGVSPHESPFSLWHRKAGNIGKIEATPEMHWGNLHEPTLRSEWNRLHPDLAVVTTGQWRHRDRTWQGGSPDGLGRDWLWEAKTARHDWDWGTEGTDEIPVYYRAQVLWYLDVFGYQQCHVSVLISGADYREYTVRYAAAEVAAMRRAAREFLDTLVRGEAPDIDGHEATYEAVKELHPQIEPISVDLEPAVAEPYLAALSNHRAAELEKRRTAGLVVAAMGTAQKAYYAGDMIARRQVKTADGAVPYLVAAKGAVDLHTRSAA